MNKSMIAVFVGLAVAGCIDFEKSSERREQSARPPIHSGFSLTIYTDGDTGCQYLNGGGGLVPRNDGYGRHMGCRGNPQ